MTTDRQPPHDESAERAVLGCLLLEPTLCLDQSAEAGLTAEWFYDGRHGLIFHALQKIASAGAVDPLLLAQALGAAGVLEQVGGLSYVASLPDAVPSSAHLAHYLAIVRRHWLARKLLALGADLAQRAQEPDADIEALLATTETDVLALSTGTSQTSERHIKDVLPGLIEQMENYHKGGMQLRGLPIGLNYPDKLMRGIRKDFYFVLAGRPGTGKTAWAADLITRLALPHEITKRNEQGEKEKLTVPGVPIGVFSLEMSSESIAERLLFCLSRVSSGKFTQGFAKNEDFVKLADGTARLGKTNIYLDDTPNQKIGQIRAKARRWARQHGVKLFVLDYLQLVAADTTTGRDKRQQELSDISAEIVRLKKSLGIPWLILAQMNRNSEQAENRSRPPVLSDLKDSGCVEQDADTVAFLFHPKGDGAEDQEIIQREYAHESDHAERPQRINWFLAKNRYGPTGEAALLFHKNQSRFEDWWTWLKARNYKPAALGEKAPEENE